MSNIFNNREDLRIGGIVQHFKRETLSPEFLAQPENKNAYLYKILNIAIHTETSEKFVIYQAMYGDFEVYARPFYAFISKVNKQKYPDIKQEYRFKAVSKY